MDSIIFLADDSRDFHVQMTFTATTEAITFALKQKFRNISSQHTVFSSPKLLEKAQMKTECVTGQLLLVSLYSGVRGPDVKCKLWKNRDLMGSPDRGCGLTMDSLHDTELCSAPTPTAKCKDWGPEDCNPLSLPRIPVGKDVHVDLSKLG